MRVSEKIHCIKINKYFFRKEPEGPIFKYKQFCMRKNCKTESSYNYENIKKPRYCLKHKKENMVNVKRGHNYVQNANLLTKKHAPVNSVNMI